MIAALRCPIYSSTARHSVRAYLIAGGGGATCGGGPVSDWQAECRNIEDKNQILLELEQGVGSDECNRLVVGLMRKALVDQAKANQARQMGRLAGVLDGL